MVSKRETDNYDIITNMFGQIQQTVTLNLFYIIFFKLFNETIINIEFSWI